MCIDGTWFSCWKKSLYEFLKANTQVEYEVKRAGDFENIVDIKTLKKVGESRVSASIVRAEVKQKNAIQVVNDLNTLLDTCRKAVRITYKNELKKNEALDLTATTNTMFIQACRLTGGNLIFPQTQENKREASDDGINIRAGEGTAGTKEEVPN